MTGIAVLIRLPRNSGMKSTREDRVMPVNTDKLACVKCGAHGGLRSDMPEVSCASSIGSGSYVIPSWR